MLTKCISPNGLHPDASGIKCVPNIGFIVAYQMSAEVYPTEVRWGGESVDLDACHCNHFAIY